MIATVTAVRVMVSGMGTILPGPAGRVPRPGKTVSGATVRAGVRRGGQIRNVVVFLARRGQANVSASRTW
ncbi:hypothetical protein KRM28CT15_55170 [Krasilnikovia sp. M28-CT-15]